MFDCGFGTEHLDAVSESMGDDAVVRVGELLAMGLIVRSDGGRYRMLEPVRQFARASLDESGQASAAQQMLIAWAVQFGRRHARGFEAPDSSAWRSALTLETPNTDAAYAAAVERGDAASVLDLIGWLWYYWSRHWPVQGRARALDALPLIESEPVSRRKARALLAVASLTDDPVRAQAWRMQAREVFRVRGDTFGELTASLQLVENELVGVDEALDLARHVGDEFLEGWLLDRRAALGHRDGMPAERVLTMLVEAEEIARRLDNRELLGGVLLSRSAFRLAQGRGGLDVARELDEATAAIVTTGDPVLLLEALSVRVGLLTIDGDARSALAAAREATHACEAWLNDEVVTEPAYVARVLLLVAAALHLAGREASAAEVIDTAGDLQGAIATRVWVGQRYPLPEAITACLPMPARPTNADQLTYALRLAADAVGARTTARA